MNDSSDILNKRLYNQGLTNNSFNTVEDVVKYFGAIQAQDFTMVKWAVGQRIKNSSDDLIEKAFNDGKILRTHAMRPTWHFILPEDIRWILTLTSSRVKSGMASVEKKLGLDEKIFSKSNSIIKKILRGNKQLTRQEIAVYLKEAKLIDEKSQRLTHIMMHAELDQIICSGPKKGKQFTYALLDERILQTKLFKHDEALYELAKRFFTSHGPATIKDFAWWSGFTLADAKKGIELNKSYLKSETVNGKVYFFKDEISYLKKISSEIFLLPNYDEYIVGYTDRSEIINLSFVKNLDQRNNVLFNNIIIIDGQVKGTWRRTFKKDMVIVEINSFIKLNSTQIKRLINAVNKFGKFLNLPTEIVGI